jgi:hypothetical protein
LGVGDNVGVGVRVGVGVGVRVGVGVGDNVGVGVGVAIARRVVATGVGADVAGRAFVGWLQDASTSISMMRTKKARACFIAFISVSLFILIALLLHLSRLPLSTQFDQIGSDRLSD